ncbi:MAG: phytase [Bacteroidales bacterium]|nr:phytase [Bacteroidales bacterium]
MQYKLNYGRLTLLYFFLFLTLGLFNCKTTNEQAAIEKTLKKFDFYKVSADIQTTPVQNPDDAADDPAIWYNAADPANSKIIGTNKKLGLVVYDLNGEEQFFYPVGKVNNVDIRYGFLIGTESIDIVGCTNRSYNSISLFKINRETGELKEISLKNIISKTDEIYGFCFYHSKNTGILYANLVSKDGSFEQWELKADNEEISGNIVRKFTLGNTCEGMVADDESGILFIAEEDRGIWKFSAEPDQEEGKLITDLSNIYLKDDIEGLTIYYADNGAGYLLASSQGNNSYAVFERANENKYLGSFMIVNSETIDGVSETDGIDVINLGLGEKFPHGIFIAQDGYNMETGNLTNQNFKIVGWDKIANIFEPKLIIDAEYNISE